MALRIAIGLAVTFVGLALVAWRGSFLFKLVANGKSAPGRMTNVGAQVKAELMDVFGQRKLLRRTVPGLAHFFTFWGFIVLLLTIIEAYGDLFDKTFAIPGIGHWKFIGFLEDFFATAVLVALVTFAIIRIRQNPAREQRRSRFYGSHTATAWQTLGLIFLVIATLLIYRGAQINTGDFPYGDTWWTFASKLVSMALKPLGHTANAHIETIFILAQIGVIWGFFVFVLHSKHLHIFVSEPNVLFSRRPNALGPLGNHTGPGPREDDRGHRLRYRPGQPSDLEATPRPHQLYRVRPMSGSVPGLEHRQTALTQARHHGPARAPVRVGIRAARRRRDPRRRSGGQASRPGHHRP